MIRPSSATLFWKAMMSGSSGDASGFAFAPEYRTGFADAVHQVIERVLSHHLNSFSTRARSCLFCFEVRSSCRFLGR